MKKSILLTAIGLGALLNANAAPIDISTLANATWNPTDIYETGTDDDTWNVKDYEYANSKFELKTGTAYAPTGYDSAFYVYLPYEDDIDSWLFVKHAKKVIVEVNTTITVIPIQIRLHIRNILLI